MGWDGVWAVFNKQGKKLIGGEDMSKVKEVEQGKVFDGVKEGSGEVMVVKEKGVSKADEIGRIAREYLRLVGQRIPESDAERFLHICRAFGLNPFKREIYLVPYGKEANIIVGYEVYLKRAERSGKLAGWRVWTEGKISDGSLKACIEIRRKDWEHPFYHEVWFREYARGTQIWKEKPITMIKKVVIAQGFRLCFPEELSGLPYTAEEIEVGGEVIDVEAGEVKGEEWTLERIREVMDEELQGLIKERGLRIKEVKELFERYGGDIEAIKKELKEGKDEA